jgi:hypothetical protein
MHISKSILRREHILSELSTFPMGLEADDTNSHMTKFLRLSFANRANELQR